MVNELAKEIHENAVAHGFWDEPRNLLEIAALCHSELSEAVEEYRAGRPLVYHKCKGPEYECADIGSRKDGTRRVAMAHRVSYELFKGEIPDGMEICHKCDNPCCINPNHLFAGTRQDNIDDREQKGRNNPPKGEHNGRAKLTKSQIVEIRQKHQQGATLRGLGREYGVNKTTIADIVSGKHWVDVELPEPPKEDA